MNNPALIDLWEGQHEKWFKETAERLLSMGWAIYPQEATGTRRPGSVDGQMIKWTGDEIQSGKKLSPELVSKWATSCANLNVAIVLGEASGRAFALDIDVTDPDLSRQLVHLACKTLGHSSLMRIGNQPKVALFYRSDSRSPVFGTSKRFEKSSDGVSHAVEVIASGQPLTAYGYHHKTGKYFSWPWSQPLFVRPNQLPTVSNKQLLTFFRRAEKLRPFVTSTQNPIEMVKVDGKNFIDMKSLKSNGRWEVGPDGRVCDGREAFLTSLCAATVRSTRLRSDVTDQQLKAEAKALALEGFKKHGVVNGRWSGQRLDREVSSRINRFWTKIQ
ncbi:bifunctional DNA primase/polymerase [Pseudovibrio ascidiaceicola]|uniref:bifunctional DNA primase/polymerase n=1 Tax=Pseudovibrio ascidiaceicola TaxID=285279 RepID=UPI003D3611F2